MLKVILTGAESSGKTTLATQLAAQFDCPLVPEYARTYLNQLKRPYEYADLAAIAEGQVKLEQKSVMRTNLLICDTDLLTIYIWSMYKYKRCEQWIVERLQVTDQRLYLLCDPRIPWESDPLREHPEERAAIDEYYEKALMQFGKSYVKMTGSEAERLAKATQFIRIFNE